MWIRDEFVLYNSGMETPFSVHVSCMLNYMKAKVPGKRSFLQI